MTSFRVGGHFGELLQGRIGPDGPVALITLPCATLAAEVHWRPGEDLGIDDPAGVLTEGLARALFDRLGLPPRGRFSLRLGMPAGGGAGASSAALMALAQAGGARDPDLITGAVLAVEGATDPLLAPSPGRLLWASREGRVLGRMPALPAFEVLGGFWGPARRTDPFDQDFPDVADLVNAWPDACGALVDLARLTSESARRTLARRGPADDPTEALAARFGAWGFVIAHTGSARGLIFAPGMVPEAAEAGLRAAGFSRITRFGAGG